MPQKCSVPSRQRNDLKRLERTENLADDQRKMIQTKKLRNLLSKCKRVSSGCLIWFGSKNPRGYGYAYDSEKRKVKRAHRFIWELTNGEIVGGLLVMHSCDNPSCVEVKHLSLGTQSDNIKDAYRKGRVKIGFTRGSKIGSAVLKEEQVVLIKKMLSCGISRRTIADFIGTNYWNIKAINTGDAWRHI